MGVIYKLTDEVVHFIISQRQSNPLFSCRQLAESASQKFGLNLSKSSVHDVLKESGIITPRGRKPKDKFEIPQEKKKQIQSSLSQVKLLPPIIASPELNLIADIVEVKKEVLMAKSVQEEEDMPQQEQENIEISPEYEGAGKIFLKAALWDLGIFSEENLKETDWKYYLTYAKGVKVVLENDRNFFIDLPLPLERCIREAVDGMVNNIKPVIVQKVSDEVLFKATMSGQEEFKIKNIQIVDRNDHVLLEISDIMDGIKKYSFENIYFVENYENNILKRSKGLFFSQDVDNNDVIENISNLRGFDSTNENENTVSLLVSDTYGNKSVLQQAIERLNRMYLRDEQNRLVRVKIEAAPQEKSQDEESSTV